MIFTPKSYSLLSLILGRIFLWFRRKQLFFETIYFCQLRFFQFFAVLGTLKIIKNTDFLTHMLRPLCMHWAYLSGLIRSPSIRVRNWCLHWAYASGTDACTERTYEKIRSLQNMLSICFRNWSVPWTYASGTDSNAEKTRKELIRTLSIRISYLRVCSACTKN